MRHNIRLLTRACCLTVPLFVGVQIAVAQTPTNEAAARPLTNEDVVKLSALGLGDEVVIAKIKQASEVAFSLEIADLEKLMKGGVSKAVIAAMLQRSTGSNPTGNTPVAPQFEVWALANGKPFEIPKVSGYVAESIGQAMKQAFLFSLKNKSAIIVRGAASKTRFSNPPSVLYTRYNPSEIGIARLTTQTSKDSRQIWVVSRIGSNAGEFYPPEDDMKYTDERNSDGTFKLTFKTTLTPGEYALIAPGGKTGYVIHDFAIEGIVTSPERVVPFQTGVPIPLDFVQGIITINSVEVISWPKPAVLQKAEGSPGEMTSLTLKFKYANEGKQEWKCKYSITILDDKGAEIGSGEREASLNGGEKSDTSRVSVKMRALDFPKAVKLRVRVVLARAD